MKKARKIIIIILSSVLAVALVSAGAVLAFFKFYKPAVIIDFSKQSELTGRAGGYLYGLAENDIPTKELAESVGLNTLATKPSGGLQHPIGDVDNVAETFSNAGGEMLFIYTQDMYDTWYYQFDSLELYNGRVRETVTRMENSPYKDKLAYCIYNEMDNGAWFGDHWQYENRVKFYDAWLSTYNVVKEINPDAVIAGPGHAGYNGLFIEEFLDYCKNNNCMPDITVWHELSDTSLYHMDLHFEDYYAICDKLGIERLPVCISEYGLMVTNGIPGESLKWITRLERQDAYGCIAYWRLANNLDDTVADDVTPNSNYWVYKFYADMKGKELFTRETDILRCNLENYIKGKAELGFEGFSAYASFDEEENKFYVLAGGSDRDGKVIIENIDKNCFKNGDKVTVKVKGIDFKGLGGAVISPEDYMVKNVKVSGSIIKFTLPCERTTQAFLIEITEKDESEEHFNGFSFERYEAEEANISGTAYVPDWISYASSNGNIVKGINKNSSVEFDISAETDGKYNIDFVYGNCPPPDSWERISADVNITVDGKDPITAKFPSTIKDEYTECVNLDVKLEKGKHKIKVSVTNNAVLSLDFIDISKIESINSTYFGKLATRGKELGNSYYAVVSKDGDYALSLSDYNNLTLRLNGTLIENTRFTNDVLRLYLHRGYNKIELLNGAVIENIELNSEKFENMAVITPDDVQIFNGATNEDDTATSSGKRIGYIASDLGSYCKFNITAPTSGYYQITFEYANNEEGGAHAYNVDLVERYINIDVNSQKLPKTFFRSTYSWENYKTKTVTVYLEQGENTITLSNDGSYSFNNNVTYAPNIGLITVNPV